MEKQSTNEARSQLMTSRRSDYHRSSLVPRLPCMSGEKRGTHCLLRVSENLGNFCKICSVILTSVRHADFSYVKDACN